MQINFICFVFEVFKINFLILSFVFAGAFVHRNVTYKPTDKHGVWKRPKKTEK